MKPPALITLIFLLSCILELNAQATKGPTLPFVEKGAHPRLFGKLYLGQNTPNPVNPHQSITIPFRSAQVGDARIIVFNGDGEAIITFNELVGKESVTIEGSRLVPGKYKYCLFVSGRMVKKRRFDVILRKSI